MNHGTNFAFLRNFFVKKAAVNAAASPLNLLPATPSFQSPLRNFSTTRRLRSL